LCILAGEIVQKWPWYLYTCTKVEREAKHAVRDSGKNRQEGAIYVLSEADYTVAKETHVCLILCKIESDVHLHMAWECLFGEQVIKTVYKNEQNER
jgi:hypothetical protein